MIKAIFFDYDRNNEMLLGRISHLYIWDEFCIDIGLEVDKNELNNAFTSTPKNEKMFDIDSLIQELKIFGVKL